MLVEFEVTNSDIAAGGRSCRDCPVALAMFNGLRRFRHFREVSVGQFEATIYFHDSLRIDDVSLPQPCVDFVDRFDRRLLVEPFTFSLDLPDRFLAPTEAPN